MKKQILVTAFAFCYLMLPSQVQAKNVRTFNSIYFFGDSLTDTGNILDLTGGAIPPSELGYFEGRITNGKNWADFLAEDLDLNFQTITDGIQPGKGINFAYSGATSGVENLTNLGIPGLGALGLKGQISEFQGLVHHNNLSVDPNGLYIVWAGANDYIPYGDNPILTDPSISINNISKAIDDLIDIGAKNILVANLPDIGKIPIGLAAEQIQPGTSAFLTNLANQHNELLKQKLRKLNRTLSSDINLFDLDINHLMNGAMEHPELFGFTNTTEACLLVGCTPAEASNYLFWDDVHPTTLAHHYIAEEAMKALETQFIPEPSFIGGFTFVALASGAVFKRKKQKVN